MHDPRSEEEKARAALKRNQEMGHAPKQSPLTREPSTTAETFGEHPGRAPEEVERGQTAGERPGDPNDPRQHGHGHADTHMGHAHVSDIGAVERTITGRPAKPGGKTPDETSKT
jgi:hypothetical protein